MTSVSHNTKQSNLKSPVDVNFMSESGVAFTSATDPKKFFNDKPDNEWAMGLRCVMYEYLRINHEFMIIHALVAGRNFV